MSGVYTSAQKGEEEENSGGTTLTLTMKEGRVREKYFMKEKVYSYTKIISIVVVLSIVQLVVGILALYQTFSPPCRRKSTT
jgi:hypothetical protein